MRYVDKVPYVVYRHIRNLAYDSGLTEYEFMVTSVVDDTPDRYNVTITSEFAPHKVETQAFDPSSPWWGHGLIGRYVDSTDVNASYLKRYLVENESSISATIVELAAQCGTKGICIVYPNIGDSWYSATYHGSTPVHYRELMTFKSIPNSRTTVYTLQEATSFLGAQSKCTVLLRQMNVIYGEVIKGSMGLPSDIESINKTIDKLEKI